MGSLVRVIAIVCSGLVFLGFAYFATDEMSRGSQNQQNALSAELDGSADPAPLAPTSDEEHAREARNGPFREVVEDANDVLIGPFAALTENSSNTWVRHTIPAILGLILYGFCLGMLANMLPKAREHGGDWRAVEES
jgi:hypothetical protein